MSESEHLAGQDPDRDRAQPKRRSVFDVVEAIATGVFLVMICATFFMVIVREVLDASYPWMDDAVRMLLIWSVYLGVGVLARTNSHNGLST